MNHGRILHITAVTHIGPEGLKCTRVVLEYDKPLSENIAMDSFLVEDRLVTGISVEGSLVTLFLSARDEKASLYHKGNPWNHTLPTIEEVRIVVRQKDPIQATDGSMIPASSPVANDRVENLIMDDFIQGEFEGLSYNLYIPKEIEPGVNYPLVQFIHDAGPCGKDSRLTLAQGLGAVVWARPEEQEKRKCFVLAPQFDGPPIVRDHSKVDSRLETAKRLLDWICENYNVDTNRLYATGQSMGCMASIVLNVRYPDLFAASYLVAGQWNERDIQGLEKQHIWMINSMGDAKAFPGMNQMACEMESKGARIAWKMIDAKAPQDELTSIVKELVETGANIIYTPYDIESVENGWHSRGGEHHEGTWKTAYEIEAIREWLFRNVKQ